MDWMLLAKIIYNLLRAVVPKVIKYSCCSPTYYPSTVEVEACVWQQCTVYATYVLIQSKSFLGITYSAIYRDDFAIYFLAFPWAATASMALRTVSSSPRNCIGFKGFRFSSSSYRMGMPVGRFSSMMASSDIPTGGSTYTQKNEATLFFCSVFHYTHYKITTILCFSKIVLYPT